MSGRGYFHQESFVPRKNPPARKPLSVTDPDRRTRGWRGYFMETFYIVYHLLRVWIEHYSNGIRERSAQQLRRQNDSTFTMAGIGRGTRRNQTREKTEPMLAEFSSGPAKVRVSKVRLVVAAGRNSRVIDDCSTNKGLIVVSSARSTCACRQ